MEDHFYCKFQEIQYGKRKRFFKGPCLYENNLVEKNNQTCPECTYYKTILFPSKHEAGSLQKPQAKIIRLQPKIDQRKFIKKWEHDRRDPHFFVSNFWKGSIDDIKKKMKVKNPDEKFEEEFFVIIWRFKDLIIREVREVMPMPRNRPKKKRSSFLPRRKILNRPLYAFMSIMALFYEKWKGKPVRRNTLTFKKVINYCIESMGLSEVWPPESVERAVQTIISKFLRDIRKKFEEHPSTSLGDIDLREILPHSWLL